MSGWLSLSVPAGEDPFEYLPDEVVLHIFKFLPTSAITTAAPTCARFARLAGDNHLWKYLYLRFREARAQRLLSSHGSLYAHAPSMLSLDLSRWKDAYRAHSAWASAAYSLRSVHTGSCPAAAAVNGTIVSTTSRWDDSILLWDIGDAPDASSSSKPSSSSSSSSSSSRPPPSSSSSSSSSSHPSSSSTTTSTTATTSSTTAFEARAAQAAALAAFGGEVDLGTDMAVALSESMAMGMGEGLVPEYAFGRSFVQSLDSLSGSRSRFQWVMFFPFAFGTWICGVARSKLYLWDLESGVLLQRFHRKGWWTVDSIRVSGNYLGYSDDGERVEIYAGGTGDLLYKLVQSHTVFAISDHRAVTVSSNIAVFDMETGDLLRTAPLSSLVVSHPGATNNVLPLRSVVEFDDDKIIVGTIMGGLYDIDMQTLDTQVIRRELCAERRIMSVVFDDLRLVSASANGALDVWILDNNLYQHIFMVNPHHSPVRSLYFDDRWIISTSDSPFISIIDFSGGGGNGDGTDADVADADVADADADVADI